MEGNLEGKEGRRVGRGEEQGRDGDAEKKTEKVQEFTCEGKPMRRKGRKAGRKV